MGVVRLAYRVPGDAIHSPSHSPISFIFHIPHLTLISFTSPVSILSLSLTLILFPHLFLIFFLLLFLVLLVILFLVLFFVVYKMSLSSQSTIISTIIYKRKVLSVKILRVLQITNRSIPRPLTLLCYSIYRTIGK